MPSADLQQLDGIDFASDEGEMHSVISGLVPMEGIRGELGACGVEISKDDLGKVYRETVENIYRKIVCLVASYQDLLLRVHEFEAMFERTKAEFLVRKFESRPLLNTYISLEIAEIRGLIGHVIHGFRDSLIATDPEDKLDIEHSIQEISDYYRILLSRTAALVTCADWQTISYEASFRPNVVNSEELDYDGKLGYKRVSYPALEKKEAEFLEECVDSDRKDKLCALITSSGQSAFNTVEGVITKFLLKEGDTIAYLEGGYYETSYFSSLVKGFKCLKFKDRDAKELVGEIVRNNVRYIALEPIYNADRIYTVDIEEVLRLLDSLELNRDIFIVVDNSMLGGACQPFDLKLNNPHIKIFLVESLLKYRQMGLDRTNAGVLVADQEYRGKLVATRAAIGGAIQDSSLHALPLMSRKLYEDRMDDLSANAKFVAGELRRFTQEHTTAVIDVDYPESDTYRFSGAVFTLIVDKGFRLDKDKAHEFIKLVIQRAAACGLSINHGTSFGFETTRIAFADTDGGTFENTYLRFSIGRESKKDLLILVKILQDSMSDFFSRKTT